METSNLNQSPEIILKWGTLKGWSRIAEGSEAYALLAKYHQEGVAFGCAGQVDSPSQKQVLIDIVRLPGISIYLDWDGKYVNSDEAVEYLNNYGAKK